MSRQPENVTSQQPSITIVTSSDSSADAKTLLSLLPNNYLMETLPISKTKKNVDVKVLKRHTLKDEIIIFANDVAEYAPKKPSLSSSFPDACIVVSKLELEASIVAGEKLSDLSIVTHNSQIGIISALVQMPGGSSILIISESLGSSFSIMQHVLNYKLQSEEISTIPTPTSPIQTSDELSLLAGNTSDYIPPSFPSISVKVLQQQNNQKQMAPLIPNSLQGIDIDNDFLSGKTMLILRTDDPNDDQHFHEKIFDGKNRRFEFQLQFKLKKLPEGILFCGGEVTGQLKLGLVARGLTNLILNLLRKLTRNMYYSFGEKDGSENSRIVFPLWTYVDRIVITKPGDQLPKLGELLNESPRSVKARKSSDSIGEWNLEDIYTFSFNSSNIDIPTWNIVKVPLMPDTDLHSFWGDSKLNIVVYDIPQKFGATKHLQARLNYAFKMQIAHSIRDEESDEEFSDSEISEVEEVESVGIKSNPSHTESQESEDDETCIFFDAFETECEMQSDTQQLVKPDPIIPKDSGDMICSAWIDMYQSKERGYETLYAFVINGSVVFHSSPQFSKLFSVKDSHFYDDDSKYSRLSSAERKRRFMGTFLESTLHGSDSKPSAKLEKFSSSNSVYSSRFLRHKLPSSSFSSHKPELQTCVTRALSEHHWREEYAMLTNHHVSFYRPDQRGKSYRIPISAITNVQKLLQEQVPNFPHFHFFTIETLGRTTYVMMSSESEVDTWMLAISSKVEEYSKSDASERFIYDPSNEYLHKSSMWKCHKRRILNCRRFIFHPFTRNITKVKDPCKLSQEILYKALTITDLSEELIRDFLDCTSDLKAVDVSILDEKDRLIFFLNLYHIMIVHAMLVLSPPNSALKFSPFFNTASYQCSDDIFSIAELEHCIIRHNMSPPSHFFSKWVIPKSIYPFALTTSDFRLNFAMNCGSRSHPRKVQIFERAKMDRQLDKAVKLFLNDSVNVVVRKNSVLVTDIPRLCDWFINDFGCQKNSDLIDVLRPYFRGNIQRMLADYEESANNHKKGNGNSVNYSIRFSSFDFNFQELSLLEENRKIL